jgi:hypothetical protein
MGETPDKKERKPSRTSRKLLVPIIILVGAVLGLVAALNLQSEFPSNPFGFPFPGAPSLYLEEHVVLSTISLALLAGLVVVYSRSYIITKANFMLGLLIVLFALLLQGLLQYPLLHLAMNIDVGEGDFSSPVSDLFTIIAYSVFLYLSLE